MGGLTVLSVLAPPTPCVLRAALCLPSKEEIIFGEHFWRTLYTDPETFTCTFVTITLFLTHGRYSVSASQKQE